MAYPDPSSADRPERTPEQVREGWVQRRREKVLAEIERNRRGDYRVPTWVLALALVLIVAGWATIIALS